MRLQEKVIGNKLRQENIRAYLFDSFEKVITNWLLFWHKFPKSMLGEEAERKATIICLCVWINSPPKDSVLLDHQTLCSTPALADCLSPSTWWRTGFCVLTLDKQVCKVLYCDVGIKFHHPMMGMFSHLSKSALTSNSFWRSIGLSVWLVAWPWVFVKCWWKSLSWISLALQKSLCHYIRYVWAKCTTGVTEPMHLHGEVSCPSEDHVSC